MKYSVSYSTVKPLFFRECPKSGSGAGFDRGQRDPSSGGGNGCFKCGESGHFSRECPKSGGGGGSFGGGFKPSRNDMPRGRRAAFDDGGFAF
jgi:hypothetical protein